MWHKIKLWISKNRTEFFLLCGILLIASILRFYRIDEYLPFLGDEGRDVRVIRRFLTNFDLMFIGPRTSIGDMYLGPLYYYLIAPFLLLSNFSPTGPAVFVSLLSLGTVILIWKSGREWFGKIAGLTAALLYAVSPLVILYSTHSWNPNIMPFFALLSIYSIWKIWQTENSKWWFIVLGGCFGAIAQSHYLGLLLLPSIGVIWLVKLYAIRNKQQEIRKYLLFSLFAFLLFLISISPLFLFDYKHGWQNLESMKLFFGERQTTVSAKPWNSIPLLWPFWRDELTSRFLMARGKDYLDIVAVLLGISFLSLGYIWQKSKQKTKLSAHFLLGLWIISGLAGLGLLKQNIYDHYYGFLFPSPFLAAGAVFQLLWEKKLKWLVLVIMVVLVWLNLQNTPIKNPPQRQMQRTQEIDKKIMEVSEGKPFNFGLIAKQNYEEGYLYFFEVWKASVREIDPQHLDTTLTEQLFVVCEDPVCEPINNPKAEIANFGWSKIETQWDIGGHKLFKLVHHN